MKLNRFGASLGVIAALAIGVSAVRASYVVKDGVGAPQTFASYVTGLVHWPAHVMGGLFGGVPTAVTMTNTGQLDVNCRTGCSGGDASAANQTTANGYLSTIATAAADTTTQIPIKGATSSDVLVPIIQADKSAKVSISTNAITQVVALASSKRILVTSFNLHSAGATTTKFVYGTGSNCGTGTTDLTDLYDFAASDGMTSGSGLGPVLVVPAGNALCVSNSASVHVGGSVAYTQQS